MAILSTVLIVEDDTVMRQTLATHLAQRYRILSACSLKEARAEFTRNRVDLVVLDLNLPDGNGLGMVETFRKDEETEVVVITAYPKIQSAVRALKAGAFDYVNKPFELDEFEIVIQKALEHRGLRDEVVVLRRQRSEEGGVDELQGNAPALNRLKEEILQVAAAPDTTVLIRGESGVGKELIAQAIHHESIRRDAPLVRVNCSSIPATMIEAELFGHERGAFTDAKAARPGLIEIANGGTLFLDEIGDLPLELQPKLLRMLESRRVRRIGGVREIEIDVRFVAATNRDLDALVEEGRFRNDLMFRLKVFQINAPALRERRGDIQMLAENFLDELCRRLGKDAKELSPEAVRQLQAYDWPGNVRELRNVIERAVIVSKSQVVRHLDLAHDLKVTLPSACQEFCPAFPEGADSLPPLEEMEKRYVLCVYRAAKENKTRAAKILGVSRVTLRAKLKQYGITAPPGKTFTD